MRIAEIEIEYKNGKGELVTQKPRIKLAETQVQGIVNDDMKKVKFEVERNGTLKWDKKATPDIIKIGNAMARTRTGLAQLRKLDEAKYPIQMKYDSSPSNARLGLFTPVYSARTGGLRKGVLYIYENGIKFYIKAIQSGMISDEQIRRNILQDYFAKLDKFEVLMGAVAGHEAEHSQLYNLELSEDCERDPTCISLPESQKSHEIEPRNIEGKILEEEYANLPEHEKILQDE